MHTSRVDETEREQHTLQGPRFTKFVDFPVVDFPVIDFRASKISSAFTMSVARCFSLLGDSNVRRNVNKNSCRANTSLKDAQILQCGSFEIFSETLAKVRPESDSVIISCITNFLTSAEAEADASSSVGQRVEPVLQDVYEVLVQVCQANPARKYLVSPPMYRTSPVWYREGLSQVLNLFSQVLRQEKHENLHLLTSFATPEFDSGGIHLTPYSGLEFLLHLFDGSNELLDQLALAPADRAVQSCENTRVLEDRMMCLEQDHYRLNRVFEAKSAADAEWEDFRENERMENCFVIYGLKAIPDEIVGKEWQEQAVRDVQEVLVPLMGREPEIIFVKNSTARQKNAEVTYTVRMAELNDSKAIRRKFGSFFLGSQDKRPPHFKHVNIKNFMTPETKIRVSVLKLLAARYVNSNPGAKAHVISYETRPTFKIVPAPDATDRRPKTFNYVEAVRAFPTNFSDAEVTPILRRINPKLSGKIRTIFIVLSDDLFRKVTSKFQRSGDQGATGASAEAQDGQVAQAQDRPPPASGAAVHRSRNAKRVHSSGQSGSAAKK
jgi:hypothetical protein